VSHDFSKQKKTIHLIQIGYQKNEFSFFQFQGTQFHWLASARQLLGCSTMFCSTIQN
jgi:hypothetical protein